MYLHADCGVAVNLSGDAGRKGDFVRFVKQRLKCFRMKMKRHIMIVIMSV